MARISIVFMLSSLILLGTTASNDTEKCESDDLHHQCTDGSRKCIPVDWVGIVAVRLFDICAFQLCDGKRDCENGEDEEGQTCEPRGSKPNFFGKSQCASVYLNVLECASLYLNVFECLNCCRKRKMSAETIRM